MKQNQIVDCVIPAAGLSSRMGSWKMMLPYLQHTILDESIENALGFCSRVILVVGYRGEELIQRYRDNDRVLVVMNPHYSKGMFSSIQQGVLKVKTENFFISHGDMPCVSSDIYQKVWQCRGVHTVFPGTVKKPGHPVLLPSILIEPIINSAFDSKMKSIIKTADIVYANLSSSELYFDVDTPDAYKQLIESNIPKRSQNPS